MTNIQAVSFGHRCNDSRCKGPSVGGTIGMATLGAVAGGGVYYVKNNKEINEIIKSKYAQPKKGEIMAQLKGVFVSLKEAISGHEKNCLKFAGIGAAIGAGIYVAVKTISGILNRD